jgi:hypothetical protein
MSGISAQFIRRPCDTTPLPALDKRRLSMKIALLIASILSSLAGYVIYKSGIQIIIITGNDAREIGNIDKTHVIEALSTSSPTPTATPRVDENATMQPVPKATSNREAIRETLPKDSSQVSGTSQHLPAGEQTASASGGGTPRKHWSSRYGSHRSGVRYIVRYKTVPQYQCN